MKIEYSIFLAVFLCLIVVITVVGFAFPVWYGRGSICPRLTDSEEQKRFQVYLEWLYGTQNTAFEFEYVKDYSLFYVDGLKVANLCFNTDVFACPGGIISRVPLYKYVSKS